MIPYRHEHDLRPVSRIPRPDGSYEIHSICIVQFVVPERGEIGHCGLEERRVFTAANEPTDVRFRFNGMWLSALDLLRLADHVPVAECDGCHGERTVMPCPKCGGVGVTDADGELIRLPDLRITA